MNDILFIILQLIKQQGKGGRGEQNKRKRSEKINKHYEK